MDRDKLLDAYHAAYDACYALINNYNAAFAQQEHNEDLIAVYNQTRNTTAEEMYNKITPYITESEMRALDERISEVIGTTPDERTASAADISNAKRVIDDITPSIRKAYDALSTRNTALLAVLNTYKPPHPVQARLANNTIATLDAILCALDDTKKKTQR